MTSSKRLILSSAFKRILFVLFLLNSLIGIKKIAESFLDPNIYVKDFIQEYLMAKAILIGINPYLSLPELASQCLTAVESAGILTYSALRHPTPHPPIVGVLSIPLGFLSYRHAALAWFIFEIVCLFGSLLLMLRWWGKPTTITVKVVLFILLLGWAPVIENIWLGQLNSCLLFLLIGTWIAIRSNREILGGLGLGMLLALKIFLWPIAPLLIWKRKWRTLFFSGITITSINLLTVGLLGKSVITDYYFQVGPLVAAIYRSHDCNISTWTIGKRLFAGFGQYYFAPPLWNSSILATSITYLLPLIIFFIGQLLALRNKNFDIGLSILIVVSILISPIAWTHYILLAAIPLNILIRQLLENGLPRKLCHTTFYIWLLLSISGGAYQIIYRVFSSQQTSTDTDIPRISFALGWLSFIPSVALISLIWLILYMNRRQSSLFSESISIMDM